MMRSTSSIQACSIGTRVMPRAFEPAAHVRLEHREARAEQRDALAAVGDQLVGGRVGDVEHRHADLGRDRVIDLVARCST